MRIAYAVFEGMLVTSFSNAYELMYAARMKALSERKTSAFEIELIKVGARSERIQLSSGLSIVPDMELDKSRFDMVFVPALWRNPKPVVRRNKEFVTWLREQWERGAIINATGTGVCFVAESGLLDNQVATTHWHYFDAFANDYPRVELKRQHFITGAGKIFCAASINAQTDLVLHHVHRFVGKSVSEHLSRHFSHEVRQPYDQLSFDQEKENAHPDETVLQAQLYIQNNLHQPSLNLETMADLSGMSERNFSRRFKRATGITTLQYLQEQRIKEAKDLLKNSDVSISDIAFRVGYQDVSYFVSQFRQRVGLAPGKWRATIRAKLFR